MHKPAAPQGFFLALERFLGRTGRVALATALVASTAPGLQAWGVFLFCGLAAVPVATRDARSADSPVMGEAARRAQRQA